MVMEKAARWVRRAGVPMAWNWRREVARRKDMIVVSREGIEIGVMGLNGLGIGE